MSYVPAPDPCESKYPEKNTPSSGPEPKSTGNGATEPFEPETPKTNGPDEELGESAPEPAMTSDTSPRNDELLGSAPDPHDAPELLPDRAELEDFVTLFKHADPEGFVSVRAFIDAKGKNDGEPPLFTEPIALGHHQFMDVVYERARQAANWHESAVFCPPVATLVAGRGAKAENLREGVALSVDCDDGPIAAREKLEALFGSSTRAVASGGEWLNEETGELEPKQHVHWRLKKPAATPEEHAMLYELRELATHLVGGDASGIAIVHPFRWAGSWHRKDEASPRIARVVARSDNEIDLAEALETLRKVVGVIWPRAGTGKTNGAGTGSGSELEAADHNEATAAAAVIPNGDVHWEQWTRMGLTIWGASAGSDIGRAAFHEWSMKSGKYNKAKTNTAWRGYCKSPPTRIGMGTLVYLANQADPTWRARYKAERLAKDSPAEETFNNLPADLKKMIAALPYQNEDQSKTAGSAIFKLFQRNWSNEAIKALFEVHPNGIGARYAEGAIDLGTEIEQLRTKFDEGKQRADIVTKISANYALVLAGNKAAVMKFEAATKFRLLQVSAFKTWFGNELVQVGKKVMGAGEYWLSHPKRRSFEGIEFAPPGARIHPGYYNLWQGFTVKPKPGNCSKFLAHVKDNAARGDNETYLWIIGWWAQILQQPTVKMETALAFRGDFGTGKTKIGEVIGSLIGDHYLSVAAPRYITGQFNSHMASLLVLHADEAFWAGDRKAEGTLRDLVSGKDHMLEYKGVDQIRIKNYIRLYVTGNANWVIPAGFKDRRWAVFDMGGGKMQDNAYFAAIDKEMDEGGREALLHHLLKFDLKQVNLRVVPKTAALLDQQIESMNAEQAWWMDTLMNGVLPTPRGVNEANLCLKEALHERYVYHAKQQGAALRSSETKLGMFLTKQLGSELKTVRPNVGQERPWCYQMPSLKDCRKRFAAELGRPIDWGEGWEMDDWQYVSWDIPKTVQR